MELLKEAVVVGIFVSLMGIPSSILAIKILPMNQGDDHRPVMYLSLFLTGFLSHLVFEALRINKWYCTNGVACRK